MCIRRYCFLWLLLLLAVLPSPLTAQTNVPSLYKDVASDLEIPTEEKLLKDDPDPVVLSAQIAVRLKKIQKTIPLDYNEHVQTYITYNTKRKTHISKMLGRAQKFFPIFESILSQHGVPEEMKYLAVVESALNPFAVSPKGATGLWQFMYSTGLRYNLDINKRVDERKDPYKACEGAARYLKEMYKLYGNWHLAIASYNCGPGNVNKAIKKAGGSTNFWDIRPFLPAETRAYVPSFIALVYAMKYAPQYGISPLVISREPTERVTIKEKITLSDLESLLNIPRQVIIDENPSLLTTLIPANFTLNLPASRVSAFAAFQDSMYNKAENVTTATKLVVPSVVKPSSVTKDESASAAPIAEQSASTQKTTKKQAATSKKKETETSQKTEAVAEKKKPETSKEKTAKSPEKTIISSKTTTVSKLKPSNISTPDFYKEDDEHYRMVIYTVKKGDNLGYIAGWYHCKVKEIRRWNELNGNFIDIGDELVIYVHEQDYKKFVRLNYLSNRLKDLLSSQIQTHEESEALRVKEQREDSTPLLDKINPMKIIADKGDCYEKHTVKSGENLWTIAQKYDDVSIQDIMLLNKYKKTPILHKGDEIRIRQVPCP